MRSAAVRRGGALVASIVIAALMASCSPAPPSPDPDPSPAVPGPDLDTNQQKKVINAAMAVVEQADADRDPSELESRMTGPALTMRTAQLKIAKSTTKSDPLTALPTASNTQQIIVPTTTTWPRSMYAIAKEANAETAPAMMVLDQADARADYEIWAWVQLVPGIHMPNFADATVGSAAVAPDDKSLLVTPQDAISDYVDVLNNGSKSSSAAKFPENDALRTVLSERAAQWKKGDLQGAGGSRVETFAQTPGQAVHAVRTTDGGAMVMGALTATEKVTAPGRAKITTSSPNETALAGTASLPTPVTYTYTTVVALYVPPAKGGEDTMKLLGMQYQLTTVVKAS